MTLLNGISRDCNTTATVLIGILLKVVGEDVLYLTPESGARIKLHLPLEKVHCS